MSAGNRCCLQGVRLEIVSPGAGAGDELLPSAKCRWSQWDYKEEGGDGGTAKTVSPKKMPEEQCCWVRLSPTTV